MITCFTANILVNKCVLTAFYDDAYDYKSLPLGPSFCVILAAHVLIYASLKSSNMLLRLIEKANFVSSLYKYLDYNYVL